MDCSTAESMVGGYIRHTLNTRDTKNFLDHVKQCSSCYDELETSFIVYRALQQLDEENGDSTLDFRKLLEEDIHKSRRAIFKKRFVQLSTGILFCCLIFLILFLLSCINELL